MAMEHLKSLSRDQALRFQEEAREKFYRDFVIGKATAIKRSMEKGMEKGLQQGRQEGMEKGVRQIALSMLQKKMDASLISAVTGLSQEEIEKFKNGS